MQISGKNEIRYDTFLRMFFVAYQPRRVTDVRTVADAIVGGRTLRFGGGRKCDNEWDILLQVMDMTT